MSFVGVSYWAFYVVSMIPLGLDRKPFRMKLMLSANSIDTSVVLLMNRVTARWLVVRVTLYSLCSPFRCLADPGSLITR